MADDEIPDTALAAVSLKKFFGPKLEQLAGGLDALSGAIGKASDASERVAKRIAAATWALVFATLVLIGVTAWNGLPSRGVASDSDGAAGYAGRELSLICSWAPYDRKIESFLVDEDLGRIHWVNRDLVLPLEEATSARFRFSAEAVPVLIGRDADTIPRSLAVTINRVSGEFTIQLAEPGRLEPVDGSGETCERGRAF